MKWPTAEVLWVARYDYYEGWGMNIPHEHDYHQIMYIIDGVGRFSLGEEQHEILPERMFFMKPYQTHQLVEVSQKTLKTYDVKFLVHDSILIEALKKVKSVVSVPNYDILGLFKKIREEGSEKRPFYKDFSSLFLNQLLFVLLRSSENKLADAGLEIENSITTDETKDIFKMTVEYIKKHYKEDLTLKAIAGALGYNQSYICQVFKHNLKYSPMRYLYLYRIEKAKELIAYSDYDLKQIATITGFKTIHHFTRLFHNSQGVTPGQWREKEKDGVRKGIFIDESFKNQNIIHPI